MSDLSEHTMEEMGDKLGQNFTEGELSCVQDILRDAASLLGDTEVLGIVGETDEDTLSEIDRVRTALGALADAIEQGEKRYRED